MTRTTKFEFSPTEVYVLTYRQEDLSWRILVFLPFNFAWRMLMAVCGCVYFSMIIFEEIFMKKSFTEAGMKASANGLKVITLLHVIDFLLSAIHRIWGSVQKSMPHQPKSIVFLTLDLLALLPIRALNSKPFITDDGRLYWYRIVNMNGCLRIYRMFVELIGLQQKMWLNPIVVCLIQQNALILSIVSIMCSVWYTIGFVMKNKPLSWLNDLSKANIEIDQTKPRDMYVFSFIHVLVLLCNELVADVRAVNYYETWFVILTIYTGAVIRYSYIMANLMQSFLKYQGHMYKIKDHIEINQRCLKNKYHKHVSEYYITFWNNWMGLHNCPVLDRFPLCLQKDILTDVYWEAIEHSHVLRHYPVSMKRNISLVMKSQFLQPGDYIYRKGEIRNDYCYIASGVVQIMSHYDGVSPVMTISSGSCLGGISLTLPCPSPTDVICATVCEVRFLTFLNFHQALSKYVDSGKISQKVTFEHIGTAKRMYVLSKTCKSEDPIMKLYGIAQDDQLKWIKRRWRSILSFDTIQSSFSENAINKFLRNFPKDVTHTSKYLDSIVLSSEEKYNADKCCMHSSCPYTLEPNCQFLKAWLSFITVVITIDCLWVPYCAAFLNYIPEIVSTWDHIIFFAYAIDIYLQLITSVKLVDKVISEPLPMIRYHMTNVLFLIDIVGTIPIREAMRLFITEREMSPYLALNRLLKTVRVVTFFKSKFNNIMASNIITHVIKYTYLFIFIAYISACFFFIFACIFKDHELVCKVNSWYRLVTNDMFGDALPNANDVLDNITLSLYRVMKFVTGSGLTSTPLLRFQDIIYSTVLIFISRNLVTVIYAELVAMYIMRRHRHLLCLDLIKSLDEMLRLKSVHPGLRNMLGNYITLQWKINYAVDISLDNETAEIISPILKSERLRMVSENIKSIELFNKLDQATFKKIVNSFNLFRVPTKFIFCRSGELPSSFNILLKGLCNQTSMLKEDLIEFPNGRVIEPGENFPLMECLQNICCLQTTVSITTCEVLTADAKVLQEILLYSNEDYVISSSIILKEESLDVIMSKKKYRLVKKRIPSYIKNQRNKINEINEINKSKSESKRWVVRISNFLHYIANPSFIIHPHGNFMLIWETLKAVQVTITLIYIPAMYTLFCERGIAMYAMAVLLDIFSLLDVILRFYLGHYNSKGVLVHSLSYYLNHSFIIDLISSFPTYLLLIYYDFRSRFFVTLLMKVLQIYRISGYLIAIQDSFNIRKSVFLLTLFFYHISIIVYLLAHATFASTCMGKCKDDGSLIIVCSKDSWVSQTLFFYKTFESPSSFLSLFACLILFVVFGNDQGGFFAKTLEEMRLIIVFIIISSACKCYFIPKAVAYLVGGFHEFTKHRDNHRLFWSFINNEGGSKQIAQKIYDHMVFNYVRLKGREMKTIAQCLHPSLKFDLTYAMYNKAMKCLHRFVGPNRAFIKLLANRVKEIHYTSDSSISIIDYVNFKIYFVCEGYINIYNEEDQWVKTLGPGSMFGSFRKRGGNRHQYKFSSKYHSHLLKIRTLEFLNVLGIYSKECLDKFYRLTKETEYVEYRDNIDLEVYNKTHNYVTDNNKLLYENSFMFRWLKFILNMLVPYLTMFPLLFCNAVSFEMKHVEMHLFMYLLDAISLTSIFIGFYATYTDEMTGVYVSDLKWIRYKYMTTPSRFFLDVASVFPFELLGYAVTQMWINPCKLNRLLRLFMMFNYINYHKERTYVSLWLRWSEFISYITLPPYIFTCFWLYLACDQGCHKLYNSNYKTIHDSYGMFVCSLEEVITLITYSTSYELEKPWNIKECIIIVLYNIIVFITLPILIAKFIQTAIMSNYNKRSYEYSIYCMKIYLQLRDLSEYLLEKLWSYCHLLYKTNDGHELPPYVRNSPRLMKCDLFYDLYGGHIKHNILFEGCNNTLIFQLSGLLKRTVYFPGDFIIRKLDIDGRMYFINSGEVDEVEFDEMNNEMTKFVYITGQCFGLAQGLYEQTPHFNHYKARTLVEVLTLQMSDWFYLFEYFPEDCRKIYKMARKMSLDSILDQ